MKNYDCDVLIIGGGPAGSTAAIILADAGINVVLVEKKIFPRETICGEFLSHEVITILSELNLLKKFYELNPNRLKYFSLYDDSGKVFSTSLEFTGYSVKRSVFDNLLFNEAGKRGVKLYPNSGVTSVNELEKGFNVEVSLGNGGTKIISSEFVIGAYGKRNILDKKFGRSFASKKSGYYGIKFHIENKLLNQISAEHINLYTTNGVYCGVNVLSKEETTICYLFNKDRLTANTNPVQQLIQKNKFFRNLFVNHSALEFNKIQNYGTGNIFFGKREVVANNIMMIGDAAGIIAPLAGDGIGMAMESAKLAAGIIIDSIHKKNRSEIVNEYQKKWSEQFQQRVRNAVLIQNIIMRNSQRKFALSIVKRFPDLLNKSIRLTRRSRILNHS
ncbi:MAG: NAD(P)/FAD-dependent oxidoreductase [Ignavibacteriales bacterium]|nr:MAG: NAD(P)/FAD-dependent oxidoreductase [Ignavibacteriales bacterium]